MSKVFVANGHPLVFYLAIKQRNKEAELKKLIEVLNNTININIFTIIYSLICNLFFKSGGGKTTPKPRSQAIYITDNADQFKDDDIIVYSTGLIYDSVEKKKLLVRSNRQLFQTQKNHSLSYLYILYY